MDITDTINAVEIAKFPKDVYEFIWIPDRAPMELF